MHALTSAEYKQELIETAIYENVHVQKLRFDVKG
jgi:hypothetical protein